MKTRHPAIFGERFLRLLPVPVPCKCVTFKTEFCEETGVEKKLMNHRTLYKKLQTSLSRKLFTRAVRAGYNFRNQAHYGAFKRGYIAVIDGLSKRTCPYIDSKKNLRGGAGTVHGGYSAMASHFGKQTRASTRNPFNCHRRRDPKAAKPHSSYAHSSDRRMTTAGYYERKVGKRSRHAVNSHKCENESMQRPDSLVYNPVTPRDLARPLAWLTGRLVTPPQTSPENQDDLRNRAEYAPIRHFWGSIL